VHEARAARTTRGLLVALSATLLAALVHSLGGGTPPGAVALVVALAFSVPTIAAQCAQLGMVQYLIDGGRLVIATMAQLQADKQAGGGQPNGPTPQQFSCIE
jgi:O-antigen/teichoic acid export membrane protein